MADFYSILRKAGKYFWVLRFLPQIIYFNFKMLPFKQAIWLPIWLYKPKFKRLSGGGIFDVPNNEIRPGLVKIGVNSVSIYPNSGCTIECRGNIVFKGKASLGNNTFISVGEKGRLTFGKSFVSSASSKFVCYHSITFGDNVLVGWDCMFLDTDFHSLTRMDGCHNRGYAPIEIGEEVWLGFGCKVFKRTSIPAKCVVAANTIIEEKLDVPMCSVIGNAFPIIIKGENMFRDFNNDKVDYSS